MAKIYTSDNFIVSGGTSSQFLKGDGTLDTITNIVTGASLANNYVPRVTTGNIITNSAIYDASGNISIGSTTAVSKLQVHGDVSVGSDSIAGSFLNIVAAGSTTAGINMGSIASKNSRAAIYTNLTTTNLTIEVATAVAAIFDGTTKNLGLGTTVLTEKLNVAGNGSFTNGSASLQLYSTSGGVSPLLFMSSVSNNVADFRTNNGGFRWTTGSATGLGTTFMTLTNTASLLINSTTDYGNGTKLQVTGDSLTLGTVYTNQAAPTAKTTAVTLTGAEILVGIVTVTSATAISITIPTGPSLDASVFPTLSAGATPTRVSFDWSIMNLGSATGIVTVVSNAGNGNQLFGQTTIQIPTGVSPAAAIFRTIKTSTGTYQTYRIT